MPKHRIVSPFAKSHYQCACGVERPEVESTEEAVRVCPECSSNPKRERTELYAAFKSHERLRQELVEVLVNRDSDDLGDKDN